MVSPDIEITEDLLNGLLERINKGTLTDDDFDVLTILVERYQDRMRVGGLFKFYGD